MDAVAAQLAILSGPDAGKRFGLTEELVHIGRAEDNQIVLSDPELAEHQASLASRNGRYALYVPPGQRVEVEGTPVPPEKWVWLPETANLRFGTSTVCRFETAAYAGQNGSGRAGLGTTVTVPSVAPAAAPPPLPTASGTPPEEATPARGEGGKPPTAAGKRRKTPARKPAVAKFITDQPGEPLVRLGEDGQLPVLALADAADKPPSERPSEKNPLLLYAVLACSFVLSLGMLLLEPETSTVSSSARSEAREKLKEFYGRDGSKLEPYQIALRRGLLEYSRGNLAGERQEYRRVLLMLHAADIADPANLNGLTGRHTGRGRASDEELRQLLETLLAR
jgi:hypothetical protein